MMEEEFDFKKVGKRMPYTVPSDFFDKITEHTVAEAEGRALDKKRPALMLWQALSVAASVAVLLTVGYFIYTGSLKEEKVMAKVENIEEPIKETAAAHEPSLPVITQEKPQIASIPKEAPAPVSEESPKQEQKQQPVQTDKQETLEELLATISDEELLHLASIAKSELYAYEQTAE